MTDLRPEQLVPRIKTTAFVDYVTTNLPVDAHPVIQPMFGDLVLTYAFDTEEVFVMATPAEVAKAGIAPSDLRALATKNLRARAGDVSAEPIEDSVMALTCDENMAACLLLLPEVWAAMGKQVGGPLVAGVPHRDVIFVGSAADAELVRAFVKGQLEEAAEDPHRLSGKLFAYENGSWGKVID